MKEGTQNYGSLSKTEEGSGDTAGSRPTWFTLTKPRIASDGAEDVTYSGSKRALLNRWMKKVKVRGGDLEAFIGPTVSFTLILRHLLCYLPLAYIFHNIMTLILRHVYFIMYIFQMSYCTYTKYICITGSLC